MHVQAHAAPSSWGLGCVSQEPRGCDDAEVWPAAWEDAGSAPSPAPGAGAGTLEFEEPRGPPQAAARNTTTPASLWRAARP